MEYIVDVGSFNIDEKTFNKIQSMDFQDQREWLSKKVIDGYCDIDRISEDVENL